jgi:tetratricopeptide (TPR) repeat protein
MTTKNKNLCRYQATKNSYMGVRFGRLRIYACVLLITSLVCNVTLGEFDSDEIDPTALLTTDSAPQQPGLDIQIASHAELLTVPGESITNHPAAYSLLSTGATTANFAAEVKDNLPQNIPSPVDTSSRKLERQLIESRISALPQDNDINKAEELKKMIVLVRSVKLESPRPAQQPASTAPVKIVTAAVAAEQSLQSVQAQPAGNSTSDDTLKLIENQLKDPNLINNPFELAEILFKSGRQVQAGTCYKQALKVLPANDPNMATERAWILFQIGNCLKDEDPNTARESYAELIRTHSNSPWAEIAKTRYGIIEWYQQNNPGGLIQQLNQPNP